MNAAGGVGRAVHEEELLAPHSQLPDLMIGIVPLPEGSDLVFQLLCAILSCHLRDQLQFLRKTIGHHDAHLYLGFVAWHIAAILI